MEGVPEYIYMQYFLSHSIPAYFLYRECNCPKKAEKRHTTMIPIMIPIHKLTKQLVQ